MTSVLIVDDAAFMRMAIKTMLEKSNYSVIGEAENGIIAVEMYKSLQPDIVTMDITMPEMNGIEALTLIRAFDPKAKVIMVSAMGQEKMVKDAIIKGAVTFIVKPFQEDYLRETLNKVSSK